MTLGAGWFVQQVTNGTNGVDGLEVKIGVFDPSSQISFDANHSLVGFQNGASATIFINSNWGDCRIMLETVNFSNTQNLKWTSPKNILFIATDNIAYPAGYEGVQIPSQYTPPAPTYVAMGDSFSSGEGNPPFVSGTDTSINQCHRSPQAYPRLLANDPALELGPVDFVACSGATTSNVLYGGSSDGAWGESPQVGALSVDTKVVTITIGGNDVEFKDFATECLFPVDTYIGYEGTCDEFTSIYEDTVNKITDMLPAKLYEVYGALLDGAPNADIYVVGYPQIAPYKSIGDPFDQDCGGLYDPWPNNWGDARAAHEVVNLLNGVIEGAVENINTQKSSTRLHYIDVTAGAFVGHDACSDSTYFNGIFWPDTEYSVHPNGGGQFAYEQDVSSAMN